MTSMRGLNKKGDLEITLLDTKGIKAGDIFCIIDLPPNKPFKTHLFKGPDPVFNEKFTLDLMSFNDEEITVILKEQKVGGSKFLGQIQIQVKALSITPTPQWHFLTDRPSKAGKSPKVVTGSVQVQLGFIHRYQKKTKKIPTAEISSGTNHHNSSPLESSQISDTRSNCSMGSSSSSDSISSLLERNGSVSSSTFMSGIINIDDIEYSREEAVIIDETLKDKESIVMKQLTQQKNFIKQYNETIRKREREGDKTIAGDKIKIQQMQNELDEMEKLVTQSTPSLQQMTNSLLNDIEGNLSKSTATSKGTTMRKPTTIKSVRSVAQPSNPASKVDISKFSFDEAENERKLREGLNDRIKKLQTDNERLENALYQEKQASKQASDLALKVKMLETENSSLTQEKTVVIGRAKLFEKEVEKLEKEIEYERGLKKKESDRKELERDEVRKLTKELEQSQNKVKLLSSELENQKELNKMVREKSLPATSSISSHSNSTSDKETDALKYKVKMMELELDAEKKSREFDSKKVKHYEQEVEKSGKMVIRLEAEIEKQDLEIANLKRLNDTLKRAEEDRTRKERDSIEDRLSEVIRMLTVLAGKPDSASAMASLTSASDNSVLGRKLKELTEKAQQQQLKSKEMEMELENVRQQKLQSMIQKQREMSDEEYFESYDETSSISRGNTAARVQSDQISVLVNKLEKLDKLEDLMRKLDNMKSMVPMAGSSQDLGGSGKRTHAAIKAELSAIQAKIMNEKTPDKEREEANIAFEKVYQELTQTEEYKREVLQLQEEKRKLNDPLNQKALTKLQPIYTVANVERNPDLKDRVKAYPELLLIGLDSKIIASKHQNDFQSYFLTNLTLEELRAIRASLPKWRTDQKKQIEWTTSLENKIELYVKNPPPAPRPIPKEKPKLKTTFIKQPINNNISSSGGQDSVMQELLKRRRKID